VATACHNWIWILPCPAVRNAAPGEVEIFKNFFFLPPASKIRCFVSAKYFQSSLTFQSKPDNQHNDVQHYVYVVLGTTFVTVMLSVAMLSVVGTFTQYSEG